MWSWRDPVALVVWSQLASVLCGFVVMLWRRNRPSNWVTSPSRAKRLVYRIALFVACWLLPLSTWLVALALIDTTLQIEASLSGLPYAARVAVILVPALLLQYFLFRHLLRHAIAEAAAHGEAQPCVAADAGEVLRSYLPPRPGAAEHGVRPQPIIRSTTDTSFTSTLAAWLRERDEILLMFRYPYAGGTRDYELHSSMESISSRLSAVRSQTSVIAFRQPQLPLRGVVTPSFIDSALAAIPDGLEFLIVETTPTTMGLGSWYHNACGQRHSELREELEASMGKPVLVGRYPPWLEDGPDVISAYVPDSSGRISPGAY